MNTHFARLLFVVLSFGIFAAKAHADSPICANPEKLLSWPATNPIWEMCWLPPDQSVGADGSGMELRKVYFKGHLVFVRAHAPMLFAEYKDGDGGDCYRDWKNDTTPVLADHAVQNRLGISVDPPAAITSCDRSHDPTDSYGTCAYQLPGYPNATASCFSGVSIEDNGDHVVLTTQYRASWYMYSSRWSFYNDGRIEPSFGFGNNNGTFNDVTHWHHNYWRMEFDIDGGNNTISKNGIDQTGEFSDLRDLTGGPGGTPKTWEVRNPITGNGYKLIPGSGDYAVPTNQSGRGFHTIDMMATRQHDGEYADRSDNPLGACGMSGNALVNNESIADSKVALYYRVAVRDSTSSDWPPGCTGANCIPQDSMECKTTGPTLVAFGPWTETTPTNPAIDVSPGNVEVIVDAGASGTDMFGISNTGDTGSTLNYTIDTAPVSCSAPADVAWLSAAPVSGAVAQGATSTITATVNAASLAPGSYSAFLCIRSNDTANALVQVPVEVTVNAVAVPVATASVTPGTLSFTLITGNGGDDSIALANSGDPGSTLDFTARVSTSDPVDCAHPDTAASWLGVSPTSGSVAAGAAAANLAVHVDTSGLTVAQHAGAICIASNDPKQALITVPVDLTVTADPDEIFVDGFDSSKRLP